MAYLKKSISRGKDYFALVTKARVGGKLVEVSRRNIGSREKLVQLLLDATEPRIPDGLTLIQYEFGTPWLAAHACMDAGILDAFNEVGIPDTQNASMPETAASAQALLPLPSVSELFLANISAILVCPQALTPPDWIARTALPDILARRETGFTEADLLQAFDSVSDKQIPRILNAVLSQLPPLERNRIEAKAQKESMASANPDFLCRLTSAQTRRHTLCCLLALAVRQRLEIQLGSHGILLSAASALQKMDSLRQICALNQPEAEGPSIIQRRLTRPTPEQADILAAFGVQATATGMIPIK